MISCVRGSRGTLSACAAAGLVLLLASAPLWAQESTSDDPKQCMHNGRLYDHGTRVGHLVCDDGRWVRG
jgi:hypothetical protein